MQDGNAPGLAMAGAEIRRYYRQRVEETKLHAYPVTMDEFTVLVVNAPYYLASDVAGEIAESADNGLAAAWWMNKDGAVTVSLRSRGAVDVGKLAVRFGGGGHPGAAGFRHAVPLTPGMAVLPYETDK